MKSLKSIIVGVDYSECSDNALKEAARIAKSLDSKLICLHVFEEEIMNDLQHYYEVEHSEVLKQAREHLDKHVVSVLEGADVEAKVVIGHPFREILCAIKENEADLLVLGSRGHQQKDSRRTGVLASKCIRKAPVEVMLVRQHQDGPFRSIVAFVDFSETSKRAAERAVEIALQDEATLEFVHAFAMPMASDGGTFGPGVLITPIDTTPMTKGCQSKLAEWADGILGENKNRLEVTTTVKEAVSTSNVLIEHLHESEADLAVLGTRGRTGLRRLLLGTTAERLIHEAPCSTLAVKPEDFHYELH